MKKIHIKRLEKLAAHLEASELSVKRFNIRHFFIRGKDGCGTAGCALGECPTVFPRAWVLTGPHGYKEDKYTPTLRSKPKRLAAEAASEFFGLGFEEVFSVFWIDSPRLDCPGEWLSEKTTPKQMAQHLRALIEAKRPTIED